MGEESATEIATRIAIDATELEHQLQAARDVLEQATDTLTRITNILNTREPNEGCGSMTDTERVAAIRSALKSAGESEPLDYRKARGCLADPESIPDNDK